MYTFVEVGEKIWNRIDCQRSEKKIQNTQEIKRMRFDWTKRTKLANFRGSPLFQAKKKKKRRLVCLKKEDFLENLHILSCSSD